MIAKTKKIGGTDNLLSRRPAIPAPIPDFIYIAVNNARCPSADIFVKEGDHVNLCQVIGVRHGPFFDQPIHSTVSGTMVKIEKHYHRCGKLVDFMKIENDHLDTLDPSVVDRTPEQVEALTKDEMIQIIKDCACVGLGGSGFPTYIKLQTKEKIDHILINGIECEPYLDTDQRYMMDHAKEIIGGTMLLQKMYGVKDARICIKETHPEIINDLQAILDKHYKDSGITIAKMKNFYPQGWEVAMVKTALGIDMEPGKIPPMYGIMNVNVTTVASIYLAIWNNRPVTERYMSVNGNGINAPSNFVVRVGTPVINLVHAAGGYKGEEKKILIFGGPMMGAALPNEDCIATKTVTSLIVMNESKKPEAPCIRCGSCVLSCPQHLQPVLIMEAVKAMNKENIKALKPLNCMECGLCTYSCTSGIRVTDFVRRAKIIAKL
ncbi:MAG: RnfABCDGE type electron transport complex subunit C [Bacilli bacterium]|nr:RnfABCDGE type electron transport complex subunit C [Bacilli bacterium]